MSKVSFKGSAMLNPVPAVLITSKNKEGKVNVFTVGWISTICTHPPMICVGIRKERLSYDYINESGEFVVNLPSKKIVKQVDFCGVRSGKNTDKIKECKFSLENGENVDVPSIKECPISLECKVKSIQELGTHHLFLAEVVTTSVDDSLIDELGKIHFDLAELMCYCHGEYYALEKKPLGKFGYSVKKNKPKNKVSKKSGNKNNMIKNKLK